MNANVTVSASQLACVRVHPHKMFVTCYIYTSHPHYTGVLTLFKQRLQEMALADFCSLAIYSCCTVTFSFSPRFIYTSCKGVKLLLIPVTSDNISISSPTSGTQFGDCWQWLWSICGIIGIQGACGCSQKDGTIALSGEGTLQLAKAFGLS